jgi:ABC-type Fe3+/spermidine/putrescine transport system ATPase subunit
VPTIELQRIDNFGCKGVHLEVSDGELLVLLGPNGAGKTTLLHVIAGLVPYDGTVRFDGMPVDPLPARERGVGCVFQDLALFPHLTVASNIAYGLHPMGGPRKKIAERVAELLELLRIAHLASRYPNKLSGGEKQRVALARALAPRPRFLLLDEPFGSLDPPTSGFLRMELKHLQRELGTTTIFVTHDLVEAEELADRIAVMQEGRVAQVGRPADVLFSPRTDQVALYIGTPNVLTCQRTRLLRDGLAEVSCNGLKIVVPHSGNSLRQIAVLPRDVLVSLRRPSPELNAFEGVVNEIRAMPARVQTVVDVGGCRVRAELSRRQFEAMALRRGTRVFVALNLMKIRTRAGPHDGASA